MPTENVTHVQRVFVGFTNHFIDKAPVPAGYIQGTAENGFIMPVQRSAIPARRVM